MIDKKTRVSAGTGERPLLLTLIVSAFHHGDVAGSQRAAGPVRSECSERPVWELGRRQVKSYANLRFGLTTLESLAGNIRLLKSMAKP